MVAICWLYYILHAGHLPQRKKERARKKEIERERKKLTKRERERKRERLSQGDLWREWSLRGGRDPCRQIMATLCSQQKPPSAMIALF